jgi:hypothetical protein
VDGLTHVHVPPKVSQTASPAKVPEALKPKLAALSPNPDDKPVPAKMNSPVAAKAAFAGFADLLMSVISPSAKAETMQPEMQPAAKQVKRVAVSAIPLASSRRELPPLTAEQKRLKIAQDGFADVMALAFQYPDAYGFRSDERLADAKLGNPIPIYRVAQQARAHYLGQPVASLLQPAEEWIFPIILDNHVRFMVQVRSVGGEYVLGNNSRGLAMVYDKILARWPASEGYHPQLVVVANLPGYYFTVPELPGQNLTDTSRMLDFNPSPSPASVVLAGWR